MVAHVYCPPTVVEVTFTVSADVCPFASVNVKEQDPPALAVTVNDVPDGGRIAAIPAHELLEASNAPE
jgi:hypothetical protein